jgi:hypothetical protein
VSLCSCGCAGDAEPGADGAVPGAVQAVQASGAVEQPGGHQLHGERGARGGARGFVGGVTGWLGKARTRVCVGIQTYMWCSPAGLCRQMLCHHLTVHTSALFSPLIPSRQMASSIPQFLSASSSRLWGHQLLVLLFKMGVTWPIMAALMHRLPWQDTAALCCAFCTWLCLAWSRPMCNHIAEDAGDAAFVTQLAGALDMLTGLGTSMGVGRTEYGSTSSIDNWAPVAQQITAACLSSSRSSFGNTSDTSSSSSSIVMSSSDCQSLLFGQCMALVTTVTLWVGVCVIMFCVVLAEDHSKWRWWHSSGARRLGAPPPKYAAISTWSFLCSRLLYLHILLDVPLMVLWMGLTSWYRQPVKALGGY